MYFLELDKINGKRKTHVFHSESFANDAYYIAIESKTISVATIRDENGNIIKQSKH